MLVLTFAPLHLCPDLWHNEHMVVSPIATSTGGAFSFSHWIYLFTNILQLALSMYILCALPCIWISSYENEPFMNSAVFAAQCHGNRLKPRQRAGHSFLMPSRSPLRRSASNIATSKLFFRSVCSRIALKGMPQGCRLTEITCTHLQNALLESALASFHAMHTNYLPLLAFDGRCGGNLPKDICTSRTIEKVELWIAP